MYGELCKVLLPPDLLIGQNFRKPCTLLPCPSQLVPGGTNLGGTHGPMTGSLGGPTSMVREYNCGNGGWPFQSTTASLRTDIANSMMGNNMSNPDSPREKKRTRSMSQSCSTAPQHHIVVEGQILQKRPRSNSVGAGVSYGKSSLLVPLSQLGPQGHHLQQHVFQSHQGGFPFISEIAVSQYDSPSFPEYAHEYTSEYDEYSRGYSHEYSPDQSQNYYGIQQQIFSRGQLYNPAANQMSYPGYPSSTGYQTCSGSSNEISISPGQVSHMTSSSPSGPIPWRQPTLSSTPDLPDVWGTSSTTMESSPLISAQSEAASGSSGTFGVGSKFSGPSKVSGGGGILVLSDIPLTKTPRAFSKDKTMPKILEQGNDAIEQELNDPLNSQLEQSLETIARHTTALPENAPSSEKALLTDYFSIEYFSNATSSLEDPRLSSEQGLNELGPFNEDCSSTEEPPEESLDKRLLDMITSSSPIPL